MQRDKQTETNEFPQHTYTDTSPWGKTPDEIPFRVASYLTIDKLSIPLNKRLYSIFNDPAIWKAQYHRWNRYINPIFPGMQTEEPANHREALMKLIKNLSPIDKKIIRAYINGDSATIKHLSDQTELKAQVRDRLLMIAAADSNINLLNELECTLEEVGRLELVIYAGHAENKQDVLNYFWGLLKPNESVVKKLIWSAILNQCNFLPEILEEKPFFIHYDNFEGAYGISPFMFATYYGHSEYLNQIEAAQIESPNTTFDPNKQMLISSSVVAPVLAGAAEANRLDCLRFLLTLRANPNAADETGCVALMDASLAGNTACVELLLQHDASIDIEGLGKTALINASSNGHTDCVELLLQHGANPNLQNSLALELASKYGHNACAALLRLAMSLNPSESVNKPTLQSAYEAHPKTFKRVVRDMLNKDDGKWKITEKMREQLLEDPTVASSRATFMMP